MPEYRVKPGYRHGVGKAYGPGDIVELTEEAAAGFLDKLERVEAQGEAQPVVDEPEVITFTLENPAEEEPEAPSVIPDKPAPKATMDTKTKTPRTRRKKAAPKATG